MTAQELLANVHSDDPRELFLYFALHASECRTHYGTRLLDLTDFTTFLIELADALKPEPLRIPRIDKIDSTCSICGHLHTGEEECEMDCGAGRICRCPNQVRA